MRFQRYIKEGGQTGLGADGLSKARLKTLLYKETKKCTFNKIWKDTAWNGPQCIWDAFNRLDLNWHITKSEYRKDKDGISKMPSSKEWTFEIKWENDKGKWKTIGGMVTAAGAGSVEDPLSRYDVNMVVW